MLSNLSYKTDLHFTLSLNDKSMCINRIYVTYFMNLDYHVIPSVDNFYEIKIMVIDAFPSTAIRNFKHMLRIRRGKRKV